MQRLAVVGIAAICSVTHAADQKQFTCEMVKDKPTRALCVETFAQMREQIHVFEAEKADMQSKTAAKQTEEANKRAELREFVERSEKALTTNYKDPMSAQFTELSFTQGSYGKSLCGLVNAKNSYGGYVGARKFYVSWPNFDSGPFVWQESQRLTDLVAPQAIDMYQKVLEQEAQSYAAHCSADSNEVIKIKQGDL